MSRYYYSAENALNYLKKHLAGDREINFNDTLYFGFLGCYCDREFLAGRFDIDGEKIRIDKYNDAFCNIYDFSILHDVLKEILKRDLYLKVG